MNRSFELQINFQNDWNWIYAFFLEFKICRHIQQYRRHGIYDKKKPGNLQKISLFSKRYIISNVIGIENYIWCFLFLAKQSTGHMSDRTQKCSDLSLRSCNNGISFICPGTRGWGFLLFWAWILLVAKNLLRLLYLPIKNFAKTTLKISNDMSLPSFA